MAATTKNTAFWDVIPCNLVDHYQSFGRTHCLHLQGKRLTQAWKKGYRHREMEGQDRGPKQSKSSNEQYKSPNSTVTGKKIG
jgi:hypothetical protein